MKVKEMRKENDTEKGRHIYQMVIIMKGNMYGGKDKAR